MSTFDAEWYVKTYPDVAILGINPHTHYETYGRAMGRLPCPPPESQNHTSKMKVGDEVSLPVADRKPVLENAPEAEAFAASTLAKYKGDLSFPADCDPPLVTVVMTSYNAEDTIENAVLSLINQSWPNLEIIVCDDKSSDSTWEILTSLQKKSPAVLKIFRLGSNSGTYIAKNVAIASAKGEFVLFQDSDDYSHPDRVKVQVLPLLRNPDLMATRTKYCRFDPETKRIIPIAGLLSKYGLITLGVRRQAFLEIGYFDAVRKAGDDEWYQRLVQLYGKNTIQSQDVTLYLAELRENSLIADMLTRKSDGSIDQSSSADRKAYVKTFQSRFADSSKGKTWYKESFPPVPKHAITRYPDSVAALPARREPVFASVCSIPSRVNDLEKVVERILPQVDHLYVYLDKYTKIPPFLDDKTNITVWRSEDYDRDFRDNGKFLAFDILKKKLKNFYYVTVDDDLIYPHDYVRTLIANIEAYARKAVVGLHGVIYEEEPTGYFRRRFIYHFARGTFGKAHLVNNIGSGTMAFHSTVFPTLNPTKWEIGGMVDIFLSMEARSAGAPMVCIDRVDGWLVESNMGEDNPTLFHEFKNKDDVIVEKLRRQAPWGYQGILDCVISQEQPLRDNLIKLLPKFADRISIGQVFGRLRGQ